MWQLRSFAYKNDVVDILSERIENYIEAHVFTIVLATSEQPNIVFFFIFKTFIVQFGQKSQQHRVHDRLTT